MSTFSELDYRVRSIIRQAAQPDVTKLLREGENDYIERTWCLEKVYVVNTSDLNEGTLAALYDLQSDFIHEFRVEWNGTKITKDYLNNPAMIYKSDGTPWIGTPIQYLIEGNQMRFLPKPSAHGYWGMWYVYYNTSTSVESPIIPSIEHAKLVNYAIYRYFEMIGEFDKSERYRSLYLQDTAAAFQRYKSRRGKQRRFRSSISTAYINRVQTTVTEE